MPSGEKQAIPPDEVQAPSADPLREIVTEISALRQFVQQFLIALADQAQARLRRTVLMLLMKVGLLTMGAVFAVSLVIYLVRGIDGALVALSGREWLGHLLTGILGLGGLFGSVYWYLVNNDRVRQEEKAEKYERRKDRQRETLGTDATQAAGSFA